MKNEEILINYYKILNDKIKNKDFVIDKSGVKVSEIINCQIKCLNPYQPLLEFTGRKSPEKYIKQESDWYNSKDLNIKGHVDNVAIWNQVADEDGYINSNYGWCIYSKENFKQYKNCLNELNKNKETRRACMIYTRPSIQYEYNQDGMSDFICTYGVQCFIRNKKLIYIVMMRSNDAIFGFFNDFAWHCEVYQKLYKDLLIAYPYLECGYIDWNANSFHVYERHFEMLKTICEE